MDSINNQPDWDLIGRYMAGEATTDEQALVRKWLAAHPEDARLLGLLDQAGQAMAPPLVSDFETEAALRRVKARAPAPPVRRTHHRWLAAAAVIAALGLWTLLRSREHTEQLLPQVAGQVITTTTAQLDTVLLDDGSRIIVAPNSQVTVSSRSATLRGQAYFDVVHDESRPFTVRTTAALVRDLGTAFDVREEPDSAVVVEVTSGIVDLRAIADSTAPGVTLQPGDRGQLRRGQLAVERGQVRGIPAWTGGRLVFENASMAEVQHGLHRWYGVQLQVHDSIMQNRHLTATFASEPIDQVLHILALAVGGTIERRGNVAVLHSTPSTTTR